MRRTAIMLLQHGPLTVQEIHAITGWKSYRRTWQILHELLDEGVLRRVKRGTYALA